MLPKTGKNEFTKTYRRRLAEEIGRWPTNQVFKNKEKIARYCRIKHISNRKSIDIQ